MSTYIRTMYFLWILFVCNWFYTLKTIVIFVCQNKVNFYKSNFRTKFLLCFVHPHFISIDMCMH